MSKSYYICTICNNKFNQKNQLERHLIRFTGCKKLCYDTVLSNLIEKIISNIENKLYEIKFEEELNKNKLSNHKKTSALISLRCNLQKLENVANNHTEQFNDEQRQAFNQVIEDLKDKIRTNLI